MQRVFLDANVLFSASYMEKTGLLRLWKLHAVKLVTSEYAVEEAAGNLPESVQRDRLTRLLNDVEITHHTLLLPALPDDVTLPEKDAPNSSGRNELSRHGSLDWRCDAFRTIFQKDGWWRSHHAAG